jgi:drug/metabolite transporter (DMT)-like permease
VLVVAAALLAGAPPSPAQLSAEVLWSVAALGALGTGVAFLIHTRNIRLAGASTASMVTYLLPVVATIVGVLVLDERLTWYQPIGALVVLGAVAISQGTPPSWLTRRRQPVIMAANTPVASEAACVEVDEDRTGLTKQR